jgi:hypothetical protein
MRALDASSVTASAMTNFRICGLLRDLLFLIKLECLAFLKSSANLNPNAQVVSPVGGEIVAEPAASRHACKLGLEGIVSKRLGSPYRSGPITALGQEQEPECASGKAGSRGGSGPMKEEMKVSPATATPPEDLNLDYLRVMIAKKRKWNSYWDWPDRPVKERGIVADILRRSGVQVTRLASCVGDPYR